MLQPFLYMPTLDAALEEDLGPGDTTTRSTVPVNLTGRAELWAYGDGVLCGRDLFDATFRRVSKTIETSWSFEEGDSFRAGDRLGCLYGRYAGLLMAEQTALNFLRHLCAISTATAEAVRELEGTGVRILDTRMTTPGLRYLEKHAVRVGGGINHRLHLGDGISLSRNHILAAGGLAKALEGVRRLAPATLRPEVEVTSEAEVEEALALGVEILFCREMDKETIARICKRVGDKAFVECRATKADRGHLRELAECGVQYISLAWINHAEPIDIRLKFCSEYKAPN